MCENIFMRLTRILLFVCIEADNLRILNTEIIIIDYFQCNSIVSYIHSLTTSHLSHVL